MLGLIDLVRQAGATLVGCGIAVEKAFQPGGRRLREMGIGWNPWPGCPGWGWRGGICRLNPIRYKPGLLHHLQQPRLSLSVLIIRKNS